MRLINRILASSLAVVLVAGVAAPTSAHAWPLGKANLHPGTDSAKTIAVQFHNNCGSEQALSINGTVYTLAASQSITVKAPAGAQVVAETAGEKHAKGDVLYVVRADLKNATISFN